MSNVRRKKSLMTNHPSTCAVADCGKPSTASYVFCVDHVHRAYPCVVDGCERPVAAYNKSGYCYDHRWLAQKMRRLARADEDEKMRAEAAAAPKPPAKRTRKKKDAP